jgi:hypothetical protein
MKVVRKKYDFFASLKSLKKGLDPDLAVSQRCGSGSATKGQGSPTPLVCNSSSNQQSFLFGGMTFEIHLSGLLHRVSAN